MRRVSAQTTIDSFKSSHAFTLAREKQMGPNECRRWIRELGRRRRRRRYVIYIYIYMYSCILHTYVRTHNVYTNTNKLDATSLLSVTHKRK